MASKFKPSAADLKGFVASVERAEKKNKHWRAEYRTYQGLFVNDPTTLNRESPGGNQALGANETTTVVRNGVSVNVVADMRRLSIKDARFGAVPMESLIMRDTRFGPVAVDGTSAAEAQSEVLTHMFRDGQFTEQFTPVLEDAKIANKGWMKLVTPDTADAPETQVWVESCDEYEDDTQSKKIKPRKPVNSLANARFPGLIWVNVDDVIPDADAVMRNELNSITHRLMKPLENMKSAEVEDYTLEIDPKDGKLKRKPVLDEQGEPVKRPKYQNLDGLEGNYQYYLDKRDGYSRKKGDIRNENLDSTTDKDPKDYLVFFERNQKFPADSGVIRKEFGGVPKTIDGFVYAWVVYVENTKEGVDDGPTLIRFDWYPVDLGGFALDYLQLRPKAGSANGFSDIRNYYQAVALENYWNSYDTLWYAAVKPEKIWNKNLVDPEMIKSIQQGGHYDNVMADVPNGQSTRDACYITEFSDRPQGVDMLKGRMREIQDEASGRSANQRLQGNNQQSATQSSLIQQNADDQLAFDVETVKSFVERLAQKRMRLFIAGLPDNGRFEVPGSDGGFVQMDRMQLDIACFYRLDYASFAQAYNPIVNRQVQEFLMGVTQTPPQLWDKMRPFWKFQASQFPPAALSAFREFEKIAFGTKPTTDPDQEQALMREGVPVEPDPNENFIDTIPKHQKMLQEITSNPMFSGWNEPAKTGKVPRALLSAHYAKSVTLAEARGMGPALGLSGDMAGAQRKERGSGPGAGRISQSPTPETADVAGGAMSLPSPMGGM